MKAGRDHQVPLSCQALDILKTQRDQRLNQYIFPGRKQDRPLSSIVKPLKSLGVRDATVHGFRSSFTDWAGDETDYPPDLIEICLAHASGDKTTQAYRRKEALERRRPIMQDWANFCDSACS